MKIKPAHGGLGGEFFNLGPELGSHRNGNSISSIRVSNRTISFSLDNTGGEFEGSLSDDGKEIVGNWQPEFGPSHPLTFSRASKHTAWNIDPSPHTVRFIQVQDSVRLEVLDWGGRGPPLVFLAGLGNSAHEFDELAPKFIKQHHVYAITRRGFGRSSSAPPTDENYDADRLGDDVLAVIDALKLDKPVLAGHSIAGEELSSIGTRHPEKVAGLIYLDAVSQYSFYNPEIDDFVTDTAIVRRDLDKMFDLERHPVEWLANVDEIEELLPHLQKSMEQIWGQLKTLSDAKMSQKPEDVVSNKVLANTRKYFSVKVPVLAIFADPHPCQPNCDRPLMQKMIADDAARADNFEMKNPNARVVRLPNASHFVWRSDDEVVEREMNKFMDGLPKH